MSYHKASVPSTERREEFVLDSAADLANLPTDVAPGSIAYVADATAAVYMLAPSRVWKLFGGGGSNG